jgi:hypothetical protein
LRYTISAKEYALLHKYVLSRSRAIKKRVPTVETVTRMMDGPQKNPPRAQKPGAAKGEAESGNTGAAGSPVAKPADDFNARAIRHSIRVFVATGALMKAWSTVSGRLMASKQE